MTASMIHEGAECFMRRALYFAQREVASEPRIVPLPATWLSYYILYRSGMGVDAIAALVDANRKHVAARLLTCMALRRQPAVAARLEALIAEMGRINFEPRSAELRRFPGPSRLAAPQSLEIA